jgi:hypothetical protein
MKQNTPYSELQTAIHALSIVQAESGKQLKTQLLLTYESLQPVSIFKSVINEAAASPNFIESISGSLMGLLGGYLSRKVSVGTSHNPFRRLIGSVLQFGITNIIALYPNAIMTLGKCILRSIFRKKEKFDKKE